MNSFDIAGHANQRILDFISASENRRLLPATGYYSTPFRGTLFKSERAAEVAQELERGAGIDVLWFGSNPCVGESLQFILEPPSDSGHFPSFRTQKGSGLFGSSRWGEGGSRIPDWSPLQRPARVWRTYRDALSQVADLDRVAMANAIPWGSKTTEDFVRKVGELDGTLLQRALAFVDDLSSEIVEALRPKLIVVPLSLARNNPLLRVRRLAISLERATGRLEHRLDLGVGPFNFHTGEWHSKSWDARMLFVRHPSSLKFSDEAMKRIVEGLPQVLRHL